MANDSTTGFLRTKRGRFALAAVCLLLAFLVSACASVQVKPIPEPPFSAKLRVIVLTATSSQPRTHWTATDEEFARTANLMVSSILQQKGIYEVVPQSDVNLALGDQKFQGWQWVSSDWALAREVGRAVHADYLFAVERGASGLLYWKAALFNTKTGNQYTAANHVVKQQGDPEVSRREFRDGLWQAYRDIFQLAKGDLFETAVKRGRIEAARSGDDMKRAPPKVSTPPSDQIENVKGETAPTSEAKIAEKSPVTDQARETRPKVAGKTPITDKASGASGAAGRKTERKPAKKAPITDEAGNIKGEPAQKTGTNIAKKAPADDHARDPIIEMARKPDVQTADKSRVIVYDFQAIKHLEIASLILSEALREEIYKNSRFVLISREDLHHVMDELKLQQSGLVDEKQAVRLGNWMAANEVVTGKLGTLGNTCILSVKRTDMNTLAALGMESLKCPVGKEEDLLTGIPEIAKKLTGR